MIEVLFLAVALSMDAFAVSIGLGSKRLPGTLSLALKAGIYFGLFQGLMPLAGYLGGRGVLGWIEAFAPWIGFVLLLLIGAKMIYESFCEGVEEKIFRISHRVMVSLAIATSIDALAAGFTLNLLPINPWLSCAIIALTTLAFSIAGVYVGRQTGTLLESTAERLGGVVLILIGFRVLLL